MRKPLYALLAAVVPAMLVTAVSPAAAAPAAAAEVACTSFSNVWIGASYYMHVPSTAWNSFNHDCVVVRGHENVAVLALQESLNACYGQGLTPDSRFGPLTEQAVRNAQHTINSYLTEPALAEDGRFGPQTSARFEFQAYDHANAGHHEHWCDYRH
ncbi:peptidoglycan-binding domain-containing protein [Amycolatopsis sp. CA-126428]|uniref:peptidoglycan-binding domain-containing protein n=1 Tax=Amycolatopsis sp. CA-126428 TaxID=2073158 RepID=UPI0018EAAA5D|nr:peptidoglycan-binding domain-containing protein [Amycolatopsis sp. CA-126428]